MNEKQYECIECNKIFNKANTRNKHYFYCKVRKEKDQKARESFEKIKRDHDILVKSNDILNADYKILKKNNL